MLEQGPKGSTDWPFHSGDRWWEELGRGCRGPWKGRWLVGVRAKLWGEEQELTSAVLLGAVVGRDVCQSRRRGGCGN